MGQVSRHDRPGNHCPHSRHHPPIPPARPRAAEAEEGVVSEQQSAEGGALGRGAGGDAPGPYEDAPSDRIRAQRDLEDWLTDNRWPDAYDLSHALADAGFARVIPPGATS